MYQTSIRNKKQKKYLNNSYNNNYNLDENNEEYAIITKLLGNCRVTLFTNSGNECMGIIRGSLRKFSKRVLIEKGDIVVVSIRDYQDSKVDIVHKFNREQIQLLIKEKTLSQTLINFYNNKIKFEKSENNTLIDDDDRLEFDYNISISDSDNDDKNNSNIMSENSSEDDKLDIDNI
jgi:translation initiation factor 1A